MKKMLMIIMVIVMMTSFSVEAEAKSQSDKYDEMATYLEEKFNKEIYDGFMEEFGEVLIDKTEVVCYTSPIEKVDVGIYKYVINLKFDGENGDLIQGVLLVDLFDCKTKEDIDDEYYDEAEYYLFNGRRVNEDFVSKYFETFKDEAVKF